MPSGRMMILKNYYFFRCDDIAVFTKMSSQLLEIHNELCMNKTKQKSLANISLIKKEKFQLHTALFKIQASIYRYT